MFAQKTRQLVSVSFNGLTILYGSGVEHVFEFFVFFCYDLRFLSEGNESSSSRVGWFL